MDTVALFVDINRFCQNLPDAVGQRPVLQSPRRTRRRPGHIYGCGNFSGRHQIAAAIACFGLVFPSNIPPPATAGRCVRNATAACCPEKLPRPMAENNSVTS